MLQEGRESADACGSEQMQITVKLFAAYQEVIGASELQLELPDAETAGEVRERILAQYPKLECWRKVTRLGLNLEFVEPDTPLKEGDELVLIPPVSGG